MKITAFKTDQKKEQDGVWVDYAEGLRLKIARASNPSARQALIKYMRSHRGSVKAYETTIKKVAASHILLGWENMQDSDGKDVPFTPAQALKYFEEYPDFLEAVMGYANDVELFRDGEVEGN